MPGRGSADTAPTSVMKAFSAGRLQRAYMLINEAATRIMVFAAEGFWIWLAGRRLNRSRFLWDGDRLALTIALDAEQP
jgi:hypothetical protein